MAELDRRRRVALIVCSIAALTAAPEHRRAIIAERRSHLHESTSAGRSAWTDLTAGLVGMVADVRHGLALRRSAGLAPLRIAIFTDETTGLVVGGACIAVFAPTVFLVGVVHNAAVTALRGTALAAAVVVIIGGLVTRSVRRFSAAARRRHDR